MPKDVQTLTLGLFLRNVKNVSKKTINKYRDSTSPGQAPLSNLKYFVVFLPLMMQDFSFLKIVLTQLTKSIANPNFQRICNKKQ